MVCSTHTPLPKFKSITHQLSIHQPHKFHPPPYHPPTSYLISKISFQKYQKFTYKNQPNLFDIAFDKSNSISKPHHIKNQAKIGKNIIIHPIKLPIQASLSRKIEKVNTKTISSNQFNQYKSNINYKKQLYLPRLKY